MEIPRRVGKDDLKRNAELRRDLEQGGLVYWPVVDEYELQGDWIVAKPRDNLCYLYEPLKDAPDLFLTFARLYDKPDFEMSALRWCKEYGLLGDLDEGLGKMPRRMPISAFQKEVAEARRILLVYEAVLNRDEAAVSGLTFGAPYEEFKPTTNVLWSAMNWAAWRVSLMVQNHCRPILTQPHSSSFEVGSTWYFSTLLGAMYLQIFWLMGLGGNIARCEYCGRIISLAQPHPEGRKPRRDKRFCNDACRQANHRSKGRA